MDVLFDTQCIWTLASNGVIFLVLHHPVAYDIVTPSAFTRQTISGKCLWICAHMLAFPLYCVISFLSLQCTFFL